MLGLEPWMDTDLARWLNFLGGASLALVGGAIAWLSYRARDNKSEQEPTAATILDCWPKRD